MNKDKLKALAKQNAKDILEDKNDDEVHPIIYFLNVTGNLAALQENLSKNEFEFYFSEFLKEANKIGLV